MTNLRNLLFTAATFAVMSGATAHASSVTVSLNSQTLFVAVGQTVTFSGTITNNTAFPVDLNSGVVNLPGPFTDDAGFLFFTNAPFPLAGGATSDPFDMFSVTVDPSYAGPYGLQPTGTFTVTGGIEFPAGTSPDASLGDTTFDIIVTPEPGTAALFSLALPLALALRRRAAAR